MSNPTIHCFGFFQEGTPPCTWCTAGRRCKAVHLTHGADIVNDLLNHLAEQLPDTRYEDTDTVSRLIKQLRNPPDPLDDEARAIGLLGEPEVTEPDLDV